MTNNATKTKLIASNIEKRFQSGAGELTILDGASLELTSGESLAIMGPSGSGKSTLLNIIGTLETPTSGDVVIDGCDPFALSETDLARFRNQTIGFVFQEHHLLPQCSVLENVLLPTLADADSPDAEQRARELLDRVGLVDRLDHRPAQLSGGERQRVAIARALVNNPSVLLADEPTGNLDVKTAETIADLLTEIHRGESTILIVVTHSQKLADRYDRCVELVAGKLESK
jgi:lipoprotein-releasing system ATP-binding protein